MPQEFSVGHVGDATGLTLVLPRNQYEQTLIVVVENEIATAIFLDGQHAFSTFNCTNNTSWKGVLIPHFSIEVDEGSLFDPDERTPLGSLVRSSSTLAIVGKHNEGFRGAYRLPLVTGLPACVERMSAGFSRWTMVLGEGLSRRELKTMEIA